MNVIILSIILGVLLLTIYAANSNNLVSPSLWMTGMFFITSIGYLVNYNSFQRDISIDTICIVILSLLAYWIGEAFAKRIRITVGPCNYSLCNDNYILIPKKGIVYFFTLFVLVLAIYRYYVMFRFTRTIGNSSIAMTIYYIRAYATSGDFEFDALIQILSGIADAIGYITLYYSICAMVVGSYRRTYMVLPSVSYLFYLITTTGRTGFLKFFVILITILFFAFRKRKGDNRYNYKTFFRYLILAILAMASVFYLYGLIFRRSDKTFLNYFGDYFSAGLYGLEEYVQHPWIPNEVFGQYTLANYYYYINRIFGTSIEIPAHHLPFFFYGLEKSNIYTGLLLPLHDYGLVGLLITRIIIGFIMTNFIHGVNEVSIRNSAISSIIYGYFLYICFSIPIADRFKELLTVTSFPSFMIFMLVINSLIVKHSNTILEDD